MQLNNIKYKNNLKPGYFIRKVVREEHYYVDENGKEKILQVKQEFINNEDKKKMKTKNPHKKKFINTGKTKQIKELQRCIKIQQAIFKECEVDYKKDIQKY